MGLLINQMSASSVTGQQPNRNFMQARSNQQQRAVLRVLLPGDEQADPPAPAGLYICVHTSPADCATIYGRWQDGSCRSVRHLVSWQGR